MVIRVWLCECVNITRRIVNDRDRESERIFIREGTGAAGCDAYTIYRTALVVESPRHLVAVSGGTETPLLLLDTTPDNNRPGCQARSSIGSTRSRSDRLRRRRRSHRAAPGIATPRMWNCRRCRCSKVLAISDLLRSQTVVDDDIT